MFWRLTRPLRKWIDRLFFKQRRIRVWRGEEEEF